MLREMSRVGAVSIAAVKVCVNHGPLSVLTPPDHQQSSGKEHQEI
jgi:hypothetical protein